MKNPILGRARRTSLIALLLGLAGMTESAFAQRNHEAWAAWEQEQKYLFYFVFADVQAHETEMPTLGATCDMRYEQLPFSEQAYQLGDWYGYFINRYWWLDYYEYPAGWLALAKNEKTGFQIFYREQEKPRNIRIEMTNFVNSNGDVLPHSVYFEEFFFAKAHSGFSLSDSLADALVPYRNELKQTALNHNKMFYVELNATKNQPSGTYTSTVTLYEDNEVLSSKTVSAKVWDFSLPETHYSEVVMGLHNSNSGYGSTQNILLLNGVNMTNGTPNTEADRLLAKQILSGYQEFLLDHGISTYEIPRWLIDDDPKAAELTMANPQRKVFSIPVNGGQMNGSAFNQTANEIIGQYKALVYDNPFLKEKSYFHLLDEPTLDENNSTLLNNMHNELLSKWGPDYHAVAPFYSNYEQTLSFFDGKIDILCPNQNAFNPWNGMNADAIDTRLDNFKNQKHTWRYPGDNLCGGVNLYVYPLLSVGTMRRILFWQQFAINGNGILYWNCASHGYNPWANKTLPDPNDVWWTGQQGNGDGILLYPGFPINEDADTPIASLRLKQLALGINDYDYLRLTDEFIDNETAQSRLRSVFNSMDDHLCNIFNKETGFIGYSSYGMNRTRYYLGQALSDAANTTHNWGEWQTAVQPDDTHNGLEIRCCQDCGTQESRQLAFSHTFLGSHDKQWDNLANWNGQPASLPTNGLAATIASDCEISSDLTIFSITVNDGCDLTIKAGNRLTAGMITTEGNAQIVIEDGAQLFTASEGVRAKVQKKIDPFSESGGWNFISSSLASNVAPSTSNGLLSQTAENYDLYYYDEPTHYWINFKSDNPNAGFDIEPMAGYLYANAESTTLSFEGTLQPGDAVASPNLSHKAETLKGWNLVGNPYPCNAFINKSYYMLDASGSFIEPTAVSSSTAIPPCTGIMVKADQEGESIVFSKAFPSTPANSGRIMISVAENLPNDAVTVDKAIVSFNANDQLEKYVFDDRSAKLSIPQGDKDYAIATVGTDMERNVSTSEMPIHFKASQNGTYTLAIQPDGMEMKYLHLIDNLTGANIDLLQTPSYTFAGKASDYASRFMLVFNAGNNISDEPATDDSFAYLRNGEIVITADASHASLQVVDMTGRIVRCADVARNVSTNGMTPGVYVLRLICGDNVKAQRIIIE